MAVAVCLLLVTAPAETAQRKAKADSVPTSIYATIHVVSDASPFWFDYIVDLTPVPEGMKVELIRVAAQNEWCSNITVKRVERVVPESEINPVVKDVCRFSAQQVSSAEHDAEWSRFGKAFSVFDSQQQSIVATCLWNKAGNALSASRACVL